MLCLHDKRVITVSECLSVIRWQWDGEGEKYRPGFDPGVGKILWRRAWQPTPVFLPGESQGWWSLVGCCLWGRTESDTTEAT